MPQRTHREKKHKNAAKAPRPKKKLRDLAIKRLQKFASLAAVFVVGDKAETVHDLRVASRRLQQVLRLLCSSAKTEKSKKVYRLLRRTRRALGPCRNLDVNLSLIKEKQRRAGANAVARAWEAMRERMETQRERLIEEAHAEVKRRNLFAFIARVQAVMASAESANSSVRLLNDAITKSLKTWQSAHMSATKQRHDDRIHDFRIAGKRLRYQVELLADLGHNEAPPMVAALKQLQDALGAWHDRVVLVDHMSQFIAEPKFRTDHADAARLLLTEIEKEKLQNGIAIERILGDAAKIPELWARWKSAEAVAPMQKGTSAR